MNTSPLELTCDEIELTHWKHVLSAHDPVVGRRPDAYADNGVYAVADIRGHTILEGITPLGNELSVLINWVCCGEKSRHLPGLCVYHAPCPDRLQRPSLTLIEYAHVLDARGQPLSMDALAGQLIKSVWHSKWMGKAIACLPHNPQMTAARAQTQDLALAD